MAATTAGLPPMRPRAITTPSSDWATIPCSGSQGDFRRSNGPSNSRKLSASRIARARSRAGNSMKLCRVRNRSWGEPRSPVQGLDCLFEPEHDHAGRGAKIVDLDRGGAGKAAEETIEHDLPHGPEAVHTGGHGDVRVLVRGRLEQNLEIARTDDAHMHAPRNRLPRGIGKV